jgi:ABC-2 type transport system permease protein
MVLAQTGLELRLQLRNGEQLLLTVVIPTALLVVLSLIEVVDYGPGDRVDFVAPGMLALAVLSTAFTGQAIATGFDRRYGVLRLLGTTPLSRPALVGAKTLAVLAIEAGQIVLLSAVALGLGWTPRGSPAAVLGLVVLGTAAFSGLALLLAGTLRAEATLAVANLVFLILLLGGGVFLPLERFPAGVQAVLQLSPMAALTDGMRAVLQHGELPPWDSVTVLAAWAVVSITAAVAAFRWNDD